MLETLESIGLLAIGLVLVVAGAETFFKGLLATAARFGVSAFVITVVLSGFELENLVAGIAANAHGLPSAAAGTFLGGTTFLALGVAGLGGVVSPMKASLPRSFLVWTALSPLPLLLVAVDGEISRLDGVALLVWFGIALFGVARSGRTILEKKDATKKKSRVIVKMLGGLGLLTVGGGVLGDGLNKVISHLGAPQALLGNTVIAAAVEAEEVGRVVKPARAGRGDIALGNVAGTVVHFVGFNAGLMALIKPLSLDSVTVHLHLPVTVAAVVILTGLLLVRGKLGRVEGAAMLAIYVTYLSVAIIQAL